MVATVVSLDYSQKTHKPHKTKSDPKVCPNCPSGLVPAGRTVCDACAGRAVRENNAERELLAWALIAFSDRPTRRDVAPLVEFSREIGAMLRAMGKDTSRPWDRRARTAGVTRNSGRQVRVRKASGRLAS